MKKQNSLRWPRQAARALSSAFKLQNPIPRMAQVLAGPSKTLPAVLFYETHDEPGIAPLVACGKQLLELGNMPLWDHDESLPVGYQEMIGKDQRPSACFRQGRPAPSSCRGTDVSTCRYRACPMRGCFRSDPSPRTPLGWEERRTIHRSPPARHGSFRRLRKSPRLRAWQYGRGRSSRSLPKSHPHPR